MGSILYRYRIDYVFFISFGVFITVLLALITWISYTLSAREQATSTSYYQQGMLLELNKQLTAQMRNVEQSSLAVSLNSAFVDYLTLKGDYYTRNKARDTLAKDYLTPLVNSSPSIQSLQVYVDSPTLTDRQADVQFLPLASIREEPWYSAAEKADSVWIGEREVSSAQGYGQALGFVRRINSKDGVNIGVLVINLKAKVLEDILNGNQANPSRLLFDTGGRLMLRTGRTAVPPGVYEQAEGGAGGPASDAGHRRISLPDHSSPSTDALMVWSRSFPDGWTLVELTPWREITSASRKLAKTLALVGGTAGLLALGFTLVLSRRFTRPIRELLQLMSGYALNRSVQTYPTRYHNEFGSLFGGYRKLVERIEDLYASLELQYKAQREAEIRALQAMINPHFLYNTLDQLNWMAIEAGQDRISHVLELMGRMFRIGLSNGESFIPLEDELMHTECYLQIQQLKWGEGLHYSIDCPPELRALLVPKLTIQPFVENAVIHGFHGRRTGTVAIRVQELPEGVRLTVTDDGRGLPDGWETKPRRKTGGYGIRNVKDRVKAMFGPPYGVKLTARENGDGTEARILLPRLTRKPDEGGDGHVENRSRR